MQGYSVALLGTKNGNSGLTLLPWPLTYEVSPARMSREFTALCHGGLPLEQENAVTTRLRSLPQRSTVDVF
jgi:hypothetical protein